MNTTGERGVDDAEWAAQERGMRVAPGEEMLDLDATTAKYRVVAAALVSMPLGHPPPDFANAVVAGVARRNAGLERSLSRFLLAVFLVVSAGMVLLYAEAAWRLLQDALGIEALGWMLTGLGCLALSWMANRVAGSVGRVRA